jgi:hypothetical protein
VFCPDHGCVDCADESGYDDDCDGCAQANTVAYYEEWPEAVHEQCDVHCAECDACFRTGTVCRWCQLCTDHVDDEYGECLAGAVWSRARRREIPYSRHSTWNPATERWSE